MKNQIVKVNEGRDWSKTPWVSVSMGAAYRVVGEEDFDQETRNTSQADMIGIFPSQQDAERVAHAVNACVGVPTSLLEEGSVLKLLTWVVATAPDLTAAQLQRATKRAGTTPGDAHEWIEELIRKITAGQTLDDIEKLDEDGGGSSEEVESDIPF